MKRIIIIAAALLTLAGVSGSSNWAVPGIQMPYVA